MQFSSLPLALLGAMCVYVAAHIDLPGSSHMQPLNLGGNPSLMSTTCDVRTEKDHILIHQFKATEQSNTTGVVVTVTSQQQIDVAGNNTELFGGTVSSTKVFHGSEILYTRSVSLDPQGNQKHHIEWGELVGGPRKEDYFVDCGGILTGNIDGRELMPINYNKIRELKFKDGKELPVLKVPKVVQQSWDEVGEHLSREIEFCLITPPKLGADSMRTAKFDFTKCVLCISLAIAKGGLSALPCVGKCIEAAKSKDFLDCIFCSLGAGAVAGLAIGDCFGHHDC